MEERYVRKFGEGVGFELYSKGADRVVAQSKQLAIFADKLAVATRQNAPVKKRMQILKELKKWQNSIKGEIDQLESDINNLEGYPQ